MPPHTPVRTLSLVWSLLVLLVLSCCGHVVSGATYPAFSLVPITTTRFTGRNGAFAFEWYGRQWVAGGYGYAYLSDVWSSYDLGRNWTLTSYLPARCYAGQANPAIYALSVYLTCDGSNTFVSRDPQLSTASWNYVSPSGNALTDDGLTNREAFNVQRMAVPFDGVGTLILVNGFYSNVRMAVNDVYWLSATDKFQPGSANPGTQWHQFTVGGAVYHAPWPARSEANTVVDAEGLVLIMAGGLSSNLDTLGDVWQLSWLDGQTAPAVYQLTGAAAWMGRRQATMWAVHDTLFFYAGSGDQQGANDDLYQSMDYGSTWSLITSSATGTIRNQASPLVVGRRFFIVGGESGESDDLNDLWEAYW